MHLAFDLTSARQIFSHCIPEALATIVSCDNISSYIDDNLVHAKTLEEYMSVFEQLFTALRKFQTNVLSSQQRWNSLGAK